MKSDNEKQIENAIFKWLSFDRTLFAFKVETQGVFDTVNQRFRKAGKNVVLGTADILICMSVNNLGFFVSLEVKKDKGVQSENQKNFQIKVGNAHGLYFIVRSLKDAEKAVQISKNYITTRLKDIQNEALRMPTES